MKKIDCKTMLLIGIIVTALICIFMNKKEGLEEDPCFWILKEDEKNKRGCKNCPTGKKLSKSKRKIGKLNMVQYMCSE